MRYLVLIMGIGGLLWAIMGFAASQSAVQEIDTLIGGVIATCGFGFFGVIETIDKRSRPPKG